MDANPTAKDKTIALFLQTDLTDPGKVDEALNWLVEQSVFAPKVVISDILTDKQLVSMTMGSVMVSWATDSAENS